MTKTVWFIWCVHYFGGMLFAGGGNLAGVVWCVAVVGLIQWEVQGPVWKDQRRS